LLSYFPEGQNLSDSLVSKYYTLFYTGGISKLDYGLTWTGWRKLLSIWWALIL